MKGSAVAILCLLIVSPTMASDDEVEKLYERSVQSQNEAEKASIRKEILQRAPKSAYGAFSRGYLRKESELDERIKDFTEAIAKKPDMRVAYYWRGITYEAKGDTSKALGDFLEAVRLGDTDPGLKLAIGSLYGKLGPDKMAEGTKWFCLGARELGWREKFVCLKLKLLASTFRVLNSASQKLPQQAPKKMVSWTDARNGRVKEGTQVQWKIRVQEFDSSTGFIGGFLVEGRFMNPGKEVYVTMAGKQAFGSIHRDDTLVVDGRFHAVNPKGIVMINYSSSQNLGFVE